MGKMDWSKLLSPVRLGSSGNPSVGSRSYFEQDFDRIVFSQPFRKLQDKTQVFPLPEDDFVHTRLTHSLEVSSVGRSLGRKAGVEILQRHSKLSRLGYNSFDFGAIVATASLAHDLGNPPFGHSGEQAISEFFLNGTGKKYKEEVGEAEWTDLVNFEGNAQGYRLLNSESLKLTFPVLGAFTKYPRQSLLDDQDSTRRSQKKFGIYQSEKENFTEVASELGLVKLQEGSWCRHPLAFLVEAADDICYHIIDLEDGCTLGLIDENQTADLLIVIVGDTFDSDKYSRITTSQERIGMLRALAINILVDQATSIFLDSEDEIIEGKFDKALIEHCPSYPVLEQIIEISIEKLYRSKIVVEIEAAGYEVLNGLIKKFSEAMIATINNESTSREKTIWRLLPESYRQTENIRNKKNSTYHILRLCLDYISGMTDSYAISLFRKINGIAIPRV